MTSIEEQEIVRLRNHIAAFCMSCEPDVPKCRDEACPLRPVSPLPLAERRFGPPGVLKEYIADSGNGTGADWPPIVGHPMGTARAVPVSTSRGAYGGDV